MKDTFPDFRAILRLGRTGKRIGVLMSLEKELETYQRHLPELLTNEGKFVVICGDDVIGIFATYEDALKVGYEKCGLKAFLVKRIEAVEQVQFFSRDVVSGCHS